MRRRRWSLHRVPSAGAPRQPPLHVHPGTSQQPHVRLAVVAISRLRAAARRWYQLEAIAHGLIVGGLRALAQLGDKHDGARCDDEGRQPQQRHAVLERPPPQRRCLVCGAATCRRRLDAAEAQLPGFHVKLGVIRAQESVAQQKHVVRSAHALNARDLWDAERQPAELFLVHVILRGQPQVDRPRHSLPTTLHHDVELQGGEGVEADPKRALDVYKDACERQHGKACVQMGIALEKGAAGDPDPGRALRVYGTGCDQGALEGCYRGGALALSGKAGSQDFVAAVGWFERACASDHANSCYALGMLYHKGMGVRNSLEEARDLYDKSCGLGLKKACLKKQNMY